MTSLRWPKSPKGRVVSYDVAQWLVGIYAAEGLDEIGRTVSWHEGFFRTTYGLSKHLTFLKAANEMRQIGESPQEFTYLKRRDTLVETIVSWKKVELTDRLAFQVDTCAHVQAMCSARLFTGQLSYSVDEYVDMLESVIPSELYLLLNDPAQPASTELSPKGASGHMPARYAVMMIEAMCG